ncbi:hypothetical protein CLV59_102334 [Chitinophaga dinghuensis]|uniref:Uncharacterized protein n=1 Tax=Chitinophaga dinghuensis TaxID=1539050 RepID=A0A327W542_9BACT|nr:hypothetical protein [Chitinophaga dinghuensis]RAJ85629.1 hypothetical protein CLV59_102334 [Chitinophaga dinghuensis]
MLKYIVAVSCLIMIAACQNNPQRHTEDIDSNLATIPESISQLDVTPLSGYFVKNNIEVKDSLTFWIIDNQQTFDSLFGIAKTMNNNIVAPDLGTNLVVAVTMPATPYNTQISLVSATLNTDTNNAEFHFSAAGSPEQSSSTIVPLWLGSFPKSGPMEIKLYNGNELVTTINENE